ncbi:MAG: CBS domain-containing protein [Anaerolineae bacterium]|nr:CBS domain-containing protein [Anaerolineae bacterium]
MGSGVSREVTRLQELAYELRVEQAMTRDLVTVSPQHTMTEFQQVLRIHRISGTPVVESAKMVGIISIEDLIKALTVHAMDSTVGEKMTPNPVTIYADEPLVHAVSEFHRYGFGRLPVINRKDELVGIVTEGDIARLMLRQLEVDYRKEEIRRYRASHFFQDIVADQVAIVFGYHVVAQDFEGAGEAASNLKQNLTRLGIHPQIVRRVAVATYEAEMNIVIYTSGGEIVAEVRPNQIAVEALDKGMGISNIEQAMQPGFSTAPRWVQDMGFGAGMGLPNIQACVDHMKLESKVGVGTHLHMTFHTQ